MSEPRKCKVKYSYKEEEGNFIQYGSTVIYADSGEAFQKTTAIVELKNGTVVEVEPNQIQFI